MVALRVPDRIVQLTNEKKTWYEVRERQRLGLGQPTVGSCSVFGFCCRLSGGHAYKLLTSCRIQLNCHEIVSA